MFLYVKTSCSKVVTTSFLCLKVHRWIAGSVPIYLKFVLKVTHPFRKRRFCQISLDSAAAVRAMRQFSKREFLLLAMPFIFSLQVIVDISNLICGSNIVSPSIWMTKRP